MAGNHTVLLVTALARAVIALVAIVQAVDVLVAEAVLEIVAHAVNK